MTDGVTTTDGESVLTIAVSTFDDAGIYHCQADFTDKYGKTNGTALTQYIRGIDTGVEGAQYAIEGSAVTFTCTVHGDALSGDVIWSNTDGALTGSRFTQTTPKHNGDTLQTKATLAISATTSDDTTSFTCTVEYTQGTASKTGIIASEILCKSKNEYTCMLLFGPKREKGFLIPILRLSCGFLTYVHV